MPTRKHSRQRESIKMRLMATYDHPTADMIYHDIRKEFPNISLGTVYRNLSLLSELGEIKRLTTGVGPDRFDGNIAPHNHFVCRRCHAVYDVEMEDISEIREKAGRNIDGIIEECSVNFYGVCGNCRREFES